MFDVFILYDDTEYECYMNALEDLHDESPRMVVCDFLNDSKRSILGTTAFSYQTSQTLLKEISTKDFYFIVDNTEFPDGGAYSEQSLEIVFSSEINYYLDEKYYILIIFSLLAFILFVFLLILVWKYRKQRAKYEEISKFLNSCALTEQQSKTKEALLTAEYEGMGIY